MQVTFSLFVCVSRVFWGSYEVHQPQKVDETLHALEEMYTQGHLKPVTCAVYPLVRD